MPTDRYAMEMEEKPPYNRIVSTLLSHEQMLALKKAAKQNREPVSAYIRNMLVEQLTEDGLYDEDGEYHRFTVKRDELERQGLKS